MKFTVTRDDQDFLVGRLDDQHYSGVFLTPEYLGRLRQIRQAAGVRLDALGIPEVPDALMNLLGVIDRLTKTHAEQVKVEDATPTVGDLETLEQAKRELARAMEQLEKFANPPGGTPEK